MWLGARNPKVVFLVYKSGGVVDSTQFVDELQQFHFIPTSKMKGFIVFSALLVLAVAKPSSLLGGWGGWGVAAPLAVAAPVATWGGAVSTGAILAGPKSTGAIIDGPRTTGAVLTGPTSSGAVLASAPVAGVVAASPWAVSAPVAAVAAPLAIAPAAGVITNGGGTIGVSAAGAAVSGPPTAPAIIKGPSGKIVADGLWGPTLEGLPLLTSKW